MEHQIKCDGCDHLVTGQDEAEAKQRLAEHAKNAHEVGEIPANDSTTAKSSMREAGEGFKKDS